MLCIADGIINEVKTISKVAGLSVAIPLALQIMFDVAGNQALAVPVTDGRVNYKAIRDEIADLIKKTPDKGPTLVRLAWHSSGTYSKITKDGGSQKGTIRFREELQHGANAGLDSAIQWLEPIYKKYHSTSDDDLSYADLYTLAGVVAIKTMGGPDINWRAGRIDSYNAILDVTPNGRLPDADKGSPDKT